MSTSQKKRKTTAKKNGARIAGRTWGPARCGLCEKKSGLTKTACCSNWICDDAENYVLFSYRRNSCYRNHDRYTMCAAHSHEGHKGDWKTCQKCAKDYETEMYVWYGTNEYNFEKLPNPPSYKPTHCVRCKRIIRLGEDGYAYSDKGYECDRCSPIPQ
ncbi:MAG: hypothetical protein AAB539_02790 [Patescibacteria group bacterium]